MLEGLIEQTVSWTMQVISNLGYFGIFLTMMIESASVPLPSEIIMPFSGFLVSKGEFSFIPTVVVGAFGNLVGSILMYCLGYFGQEAVIKRFIRGWGKLLITEDELETGEKWFRRYGDQIVLGSRVLPAVRTFISLPAGIAKVPFIRFCILTFVGSLIWATFLTFLGVKLGENWMVLEPFFRKFDVFIVFGGIIILIAYFYHKYRKVFNG